MSTSSTSSTTPAARPQLPAAALLPATSSAANSLPDELVDKIFVSLISTSTKQHPLYYVCLASRKFYRLARAHLWEVVALEVDKEDGGATFVDMAQRFGHYTRGLYLVFTKKADGQAYSAYTPALEHVAGARSVQVVQDAESEAQHFQHHDLFANTELANLEHLGVLHVPRATGLPRISYLRSITSLDLTGSGQTAVLGRLYETPGLMPSLRALAADTWYIPRVGDSDYLFAQLDMFQVETSCGWLVSSPRDKVPLLADFTLSAGNGSRTTTFDALARHVTISCIFSGHPLVGNSRISRSLDELTSCVEQGTVKSLWLPHDPATIGSPEGDADVEAAWSRLCTAARATHLPGRLIGESQEASVLPGGRLDFGFWQYAKRLRAAGEV
ncbi:hypothetical protein JCM9279_006545 [Rhodotorula babjevae]